MNSEPHAHETLPYLTEDLPGCGGRMKVEVEDFKVVELPAYLPTGEGEHLFIWIQKSGVSSEQLVTHVARQLGISSGTIGVAGMKDRQAVTQQMISVPAASAARVDEIQNDSIQVLDAQRHPHKLRTGHLQGNRFDVLLRDVCPGSIETVTPIVDRILEQGMPNYFGSQRFGYGGETLKTGLDLLRGVKTPKQLARGRRKFLLRLALSAAQSFLFNACLAQRIHDGLFRRVLLGDLLQRTESGGAFLADDVAVAERRLSEHEIAISGPLFGPKMMAPEGLANEREVQVLVDNALDQGAFERFPKLTRGARRPFSCVPGNLRISEAPAGLRIQFELPKGTYGTSLLREFTKSD